MTSRKRKLQLEEIRESISKTVQGCRQVHDNPKISRNFKIAYNYTLSYRIKKPLIDLSERINTYLYSQIRAGVNNIKITYELMCMSIRM
ncbi:MAG TPA: hypothetical protein VJ438_00100 [Candidatus Nanoarchaeia archaeon]|nr:hypothetical protein [Candidatus Nanoarchaeia archaeon]